MALPKQEGDHRPAAIGDVFRRLVVKPFVQNTAGRAYTLLEPWPVGVGTKGGAEAVHTCRRWATCYKGDQRHALAKLGVPNAFTSVERQAILECVWEHMPALTP